MNQRGFNMPSLSLAVWGAIGASVVILGLTVALKAQSSRLASCKQEFQVFQAQVKVLGDAAAAKAKSEIDRQAKLLKETEARSEKAKSDLVAVNRRLRDERARSRGVPTVTSTASIPDAACIRGAHLLRTLRRFDDAVTADLQTAREGLAGIVEPADDNTLRLKLSQEWAATALGRTN